MTVASVHEEVHQRARGKESVRKERQHVVLVDQVQVHAGNDRRDRCGHSEGCPPEGRSDLLLVFHDGPEWWFGVNPAWLLRASAA
jgi:hypothetical protein